MVTEILGSEKRRFQVSKGTAFYQPIPPSVNYLGCHVVIQKYNIAEASFLVDVFMTGPIGDHNGDNELLSYDLWSPNNRSERQELFLPGSCLLGYSISSFSSTSDCVVSSVNRLFVSPPSPSLTRSATLSVSPM